jgi:hypothetical protein
MIPQTISFHKNYGIFRIFGTCNTCDLRLSYSLRPALSMSKINAQSSHKNINQRYDCQDNFTPHYLPFRKYCFLSVFSCNLPITPCETSSIIHITIENTINIIPIPAIFQLAAALSLRPGLPRASSG